MDKERFRRLYDSAHDAAHAVGNDFVARSKAKRQLRQTLDLLSVECEPRHWAAIEWARRNDYPEFTLLEQQFPDL